VEAGARREASGMAALDDVAAPARFGPHLPVVRRSERKARLASIGTEDVPQMETKAEIEAEFHDYAFSRDAAVHAGATHGDAEVSDDDDDVVVLEDGEFSGGTSDARNGATNATSEVRGPSGQASLID